MHGYFFDRRGGDEAEIAASRYRVGGLGFELGTCLMQVDLLAAEGKRGAPVAELHHVETQDA